jgi:hypothetical protein
MTVTRRNIIDSAESGDRFVQGAVLLNQEMSELTTAQLNDILTPQVPGFRIFGIDQEVSTWDLLSCGTSWRCSCPAPHPGPSATLPTAARSSCPGTGCS